MNERPHASRLRTGRASEPGGIYLLTAVVVDRRPVFNDFPAGRQLVQEMRCCHNDGWVDSLAWVVMPDHIHWLVQLHERSLTDVMRRIKGRTAKSINQRLGRTGRLWQDGYHDRALRREDDIQTIARYIVANPLRAGLVRRIGDYPLWDAVWL